MLNIVWMLFVAWFLNLFGFGDTVITGLQQFGGPAITITGYYFVFAVVGLVKNILEKIASRATLKVLTDAIENLDK